MTSNERRAEARIRSRGLVTLSSGHVQGLTAQVHDVSVNGIGLFTPSPMPPGTRVRIDSSGLAAEGVVQHCRAEPEGYYIGIALEPAETG